MRKSLFVPLLALMLVLTLAGCGSDNTPETTILSPTTTPTTQPTVPPDPYDLLTEKQKNAVAMYNYLAEVTYRINNSENGRMFLDETFSALVENTNPEAVDEKAQAYFSNLLDTIKAYRFADVKRERIQYVFDQNTAAVLREIAPDAAAAVSAAASVNVAGLADTTIGAYSNYQERLDLLNQEYL